MKLGVSFQWSEDELRRMFGIEEKPGMLEKAWIDSRNGSESIWVQLQPDGTWRIDSYPIERHYSYNQCVICTRNKKGLLEVQQVAPKKTYRRTRR